MTTKICCRCKIEKDESLCLKSRNLCKDCNNFRLNNARAEKKKNQTDAEKTCSMCNEVKTEKDFRPGSLRCKKCLSNLKKQRSIEIAEEQKKNNITEKICIKCNENMILKIFVLEKMFVKTVVQK